MSRHRSIIYLLCQVNELACLYLGTVVEVGDVIVRGKSTVVKILCLVYAGIIIVAYTVSTNKRYGIRRYALNAEVKD